MGSGSRIGQCKRRFFEGEQARGEKEEEASHVVGAFGEYEVRKSESGGYALCKSGEVVGAFSGAKVERERVVFELSHGMNLEVSDKGVRGRLGSEKAELCGLMASDGGIYIGSQKTRIYEVYFDSKSEVLARAFSNLIEEIYSEIPRDYTYFKETSRGKEIYHKPRVYSKRIAYDLEALRIKGPRPFEFHPPLDLLDNDGKRAYLRGFFSGDGNISKHGDYYYFRIYSTCKEGLEELREMLIELGFHPSNIHVKHREPKWRDLYDFSISEEEHLKFIEEIGSRNPEHINIFQLIKSKYEREEKEG